VFPKWIVDHLVQISPPDEQDAAYRKFPNPADLPVAVAARMSLSFPLLISAVPLYRKDFPFADGKENAPIARMLFSDGGLSSNFPVHVFDALLPRRPTFGITLEPYDCRAAQRRVRLPMLARRGIWLEGDLIESLLDFLMALVNAAKDWQDRLQSSLPGYRERIVSIYLTDDEGGLNLRMPADRIDLLSCLGRRAGKLFVGIPETPDDQDVFNFDDHRWRRYLVAFARLEETLETASLAWGDKSDPSSFATFIANYMSHNNGSYKTSPMQWRDEVYARLDGLMMTAASWTGHPLRSRPGAIPKPDTDMRITPKSH
jgi:Patatin-like phospholipase